jgi:hypothetical protein
MKDDSMKITFYVTELAGKTVAGLTNPGVGKPILLTASQAVHPLRLGYIVEAPAPKQAVSALRKGKKA